MLYVLDLCCQDVPPLALRRDAGKGNPGPTQGQSIWRGLWTLHLPWTPAGEERATLQINTDYQQLGIQTYEQKNIRTFTDERRPFIPLMLIWFLVGGWSENFVKSDLKDPDVPASTTLLLHFLTWLGNLGYSIPSKKKWLPLSKVRPHLIFLQHFALKQMLSECVPSCQTHREMPEHVLKWTDGGFHAWAELYN